MSKKKEFSFSLNAQQTANLLVVLNKAYSGGYTIPESTFLNNIYRKAEMEMDEAWELEKYFPQVKQDREEKKKQEEEKSKAKE